MHRFHSLRTGHLYFYLDYDYCGSDARLTKVYRELLTGMVVVRLEYSNGHVVTENINDLMRLVRLSPWDERD